MQRHMCEGRAVCLADSMCSVNMLVVKDSPRCPAQTCRAEEGGWAVREGTGLGSWSKDEVLISPTKHRALCRVFSRPSLCQGHGPRRQDGAGTERPTVLSRTVLGLCLGCTLSS